LDPQFKYRAFISYSHADEDWARWLHRSLESYRVPKRLVGNATPFGPVPARLTPVFRDREELATATSLGETLTRALEQSACQLVICSRAAAQSRWVNEEILAFKRLGREQRIFCLIVDGEPGASAVAATADQECFPSALIYKIGEDGSLTATRSEPIAADGRPGKDGKQDLRLKLIAGMLGVGLDELKQREAHRRHRRMVALVTASIAGMAITSGLAAAAWFARNEANRERVRAEAEAETARQTTRFMVDLFKVSDPSEALGSKITAREILDKGAARIDRELTDQPYIQATLMDTMGTVYTSLGLYGSAIPLIRKALDKRRSLSGERDALVGQSLNHLGEALTLNSDYVEAEKRLREALVIRRALYGDVNPDVASTLTALADVMSYTGQYEKGEPLIREALRIRKKLFGEVHPDVAASIGDLGQNFGERGDFKQAEVYLRQALAMQRQLHPTVHPDLAEAMNNLAWAYLGLGQPAQAEPIYRMALEMQRKLLGDAHPDLAVAISNLAQVLVMRGDFKGAENAYREALAMNRKLLGASHPEIARNVGDLATVLYAEGNHQAAIAMQRESLSMYRHELGDYHPDVASSAALLAYWLIGSRDYDEAASLVDETLRIRRKVMGDESADVGSTLGLKANLLLATKRYEEALAVATEARRILALTLPDDHWRVAMAKNAQGAALAGLRKYKDAEPLLLGSLTALAGSPVPDLPDRGRQRLYDLYTDWGRPDEARKYMRR
jgi:tetratricopeptide (TPR) repeat protein